MAFEKTTKISWATKTWNVIAGCTDVSPACKNCYAKYVAYKESEKGVSKFKGLAIESNSGTVRWTGELNVARERLFNEPGRWKEPSLIFVNSMSDLFWEEVPRDLVFKVLDKMFEADWHNYLILTKRANRMRLLVDEFCEHKNIDVLPGFIWLGVSVEDEKRASERLPLLDATKAEVKFVSCEPLLEEVDFSKYPVMDWYIVGGESVEIERDKFEARSFNSDWARKIKNFCEVTGAAFHMKQLGSNPVLESTKSFKGDDFNELPEELKVREYPKNASATTLR